MKSTSKLYHKMKLVCWEIFSAHTPTSRLSSRSCSIICCRKLRLNSSCPVKSSIVHSLMGLSSNTIMALRSVIRGIVDPRLSFWNRPKTRPYSFMRPRSKLTTNKKPSADFIPPSMRPYKRKNFNKFSCITSKSDHVCLTHFTPAPFDRDIAESSHH